MHVLDAGQKIVLGDPDQAVARINPCCARAVLALAIAVCAMPLVYAMAVEPGQSSSAAARMETLLPAMIALGLGLVVLAGFRYASSVLCRTEVDAALFDRDRSVVELTSSCGLGTRRVVIPFSDIRAIRMGRAKIEHDCASEIPVLVLLDRREIAIPQSIDTRELTLLRLLTGLRRS